jgi:D-methionine transport system substrate-binding protein
MLRCIKKILFFVCALTLTACGGHSDKNTLKVGSIAGPDSQLLEVAQKVAKDKYHMNIKIVEFTDYVEPNTALNDGSIDANMFQHQPYLNKQNTERHYTLIAVGKTFLFPMGIYSKKYKGIIDIPDGAIIAIPNDPSNEGRALLLLQKAGLIQLRDPLGLYSTPDGIKDNSKHYQFKELDAAQLARSLADVDLAVINSNYAITAGLSPSQDALVLEDSNSPYANIIVVRKEEMDNAQSKVLIAQLVASIQSQEVLDAAKKIFHDQAIPAWQPAT